jgi:malate synthase
MEDLATDRIYRLMIAQRIHHSDRVKILDDQGRAVPHTPAFITSLFDAELERLLRELPPDPSPQAAASLREARRISEQIISHGEFTPA